MHGQRHGVYSFADRQIAYAEDDPVVAAGRLLAVIERLDLTPHHAGNERIDSGIGCVQRRDPLAVAQHRDAVGEAQNLLQAMRDVDDADACRLELAQHVEEMRRLVVGERRVGFVQDEQLDVAGNRLGDLHHLLLGYRQVTDQGRRVYVCKPQSRQHGTRRGCQTVAG